MANKFEQKTWVDRQSQYPSRRKLVATGITDVYDTERYEGEVTDTGNAFDAENMNDLEERVYSAMGLLDDTDVKVTDSGNIFTATRLDGVLTELFQYAASGKKAIASAIGSNASSSSAFSTLAGLITSGKQSLISAIGSGSTSNTFAVLASLVTSLKSSYQSTINSLNSTISTLNTKVSSLTSTITSLNSTISSATSIIASAIGATSNGTPSTSATFDTLASYITDYKKSFYFGSYKVSKRTISSDSGSSFNVSVSFGFTPSIVFAGEFNTEYDTDSAYDYNDVLACSNTTYFRTSSGTSYARITNVSSSGFTVTVYNNYDSSITLDSGTFYIYAIS